MRNIQDNRPLVVTIICTAYNHEKYIRDCLEGFVMQKTSFRFEAVVHDDASSDGTAAIIREYAAKYPNIIKPILEKENQYSKHDGSLARILDENTNGIYVAQCEGDDYWIDPYKLQKQYDFMESHPECSLCFHANYKLYPSGRQVVYRPKVIKVFYSLEDVLRGGGTFMSFNSMFYRWELLKDIERPDFWKNCPIGDVPSVLFFALQGKLGYINNEMSVYRVGAQDSWTSKQNTLEKRNLHYQAVLRMYDEFDEYSSGKYHKVVMRKKRISIWRYRKANFIFFIRMILKKLEF